FVKQKPAYEVGTWLEFRRVLFRSPNPSLHPRDVSARLQTGVGGNRLVAKRFRLQLRPVAALDQSKNPNAPAVKREGEEKCGRKQIGRASCREGVTRPVTECAAHAA